MNRLVAVCVIAAAMLGALCSAEANVVVNVDKSRQRMTVSVDGDLRYSFIVSTGRAGYGTPNGVYHPVRMEQQWFSKEYYNSPMPHSIFFHGGYAIHGSYEISRLGGPASHGCVRLHPSDAAKLYALVEQEGIGKTTIQVTGSNPVSGPPAVEAQRAPGAAPRYVQPGSGWQFGGAYVGDDRSTYQPYGRPNGQQYARPASAQYQVQRPYQQPYAGGPYAQRPQPRYNRGYTPYSGWDDDR